MRIKFAAAVLVLAAVFLAVEASPRPASDKNGASAATADRSAQDETLRLEGEKRFHANCGRCHAAPPKFAPRMTATIVRHMRVRATITDEDARLILRYMSQ